MITLPLDGNSAAALPAACGMKLAPRDECSYPEETAGRCLSLDDCTLHGNRVIARKVGKRVKLYSRPGNDLTRRFP
jgi:hypothetical protein